MPEINANVNIAQELEASVEEQQGTLNVQLSDASDIISGLVTSDAEIIGATLTNNEETLSASLIIKAGGPQASLQVHYGVDGKDGKDGFSPTISVYKQNKKEYVLKITNKDESYLTPNLMPDIDEILGLDDKVDEDLTMYPTVNANTLNVLQRQDTLVYAYNLNAKASYSLKLSDFALKEETDKKIKNKIRTVTVAPDDWSTGEYIFLDSQEESD